MLGVHGGRREGKQISGPRETGFGEIGSLINFIRRQSLHQRAASLGLPRDHSQRSLRIARHGCGIQSLAARAHQLAELACDGGKRRPSHWNLSDNCDRLDDVEQHVLGLIEQPHELLGDAGIDRRQLALGRDCDSKSPSIQLKRP